MTFSTPPQARVRHRSTTTLALCLGLMASFAAPAQETPAPTDPANLPPTGLVIDPEQSHHLELQLNPEGHWSGRTVGNDPWIVATPVAAHQQSGKPSVLTFEYRSAEGVIDLEIFHSPPWTNDARISAGNLPPSADWQRVHILLGDAARDQWVGESAALRLDFGQSAEVGIDLRQLELRPPTVAEENDIELQRRIWWQKLADARAIEEYLAWEPGNFLEQVRVGEDSIRITGRAPDALKPEGQDGWLLVARRPHEPSWRLEVERNAARELYPVEVDENGTFEMDLPRLANGRDRLTSRWQLLRATGNGLTAMGHCRHPDKIASLPQDASMAAAEPGTIKGITCAENLHMLDDLTALGIGHATINVLLTRLMLDRDPVPYDPDLPEPPAEDPELRWFVHNGKSWPINRDYAVQLDRVVAELHARDIRVSAVLLLADHRPAGQRHRLIHPEAAQAGIYAMPNLATADGGDHYEAALAYLTRRFRPAPESPGPVVNWIVHNEVDQAWTWCNMGEQPTVRLLDVYQRSLRLVDQLAREANPGARAMISLTHHWAAEGDGLGRSHRTVDLLRYLRRFGELEGDFPWGLAFHPYPANLFNPATWHDPLTPYRLDAERITLRNIEVLGHWLQLPEMRHHGDPRRLLLSEQGFHTPGDDTSSQTTQAAALAYAWLKLKPLTVVEAFHYHRLTDHPAEGGLRLGLRGFASLDNALGHKKRAWYLYQALGNEGQNEAIAPLLQVTPYVDPAEIPYQGNIEGSDPTAWLQGAEGG